MPTNLVLVSFQVTVPLKLLSIIMPSPTLSIFLIWSALLKSHAAFLAWTSLGIQSVLLKLTIWFLLHIFILLNVLQSFCIPYSSLWKRKIQFSFRYALWHYFLQQVLVLSSDIFFFNFEYFYNINEYSFILENRYIWKFFSIDNCDNLPNLNIYFINLF